MFEPRLTGHWRKVGLLFWALAGTIAVPATAAEPAPMFTAVYDVHYSGARVGLSTLVLAADVDGQYMMHAKVEPKGLAAFVRSSPVVEKSLFRWTPEGELQSLHYDFSDGSRKGKRNSKIDFDWVRSMATSMYKHRELEINLTEPIGDRLALQALVMRDLAAGNLHPEYAFLNNNEIKTYLFEILGEEVLDTPAGRFYTVKVSQRRPGSTRTTHLWASRDHGYVNVRLAQFKDGKAQTVLTLNKLTIDEPVAPPVPDVPPPVPAETALEAPPASAAEEHDAIVEN